MSRFDESEPEPGVLHCDTCYGDVDNPGELFGCRCPECPVCGMAGDPDCYIGAPYVEAHIPPSKMRRPYGQAFYESYQQGQYAEGQNPPSWNQLEQYERDNIQAGVLAAVKQFRQEEALQQ